jgi:hypothetical protein
MGLPLCCALFAPLFPIFSHIHFFSHLLIISWSLWLAFCFSSLSFFHPFSASLCSSHALCSLSLSALLVLSVLSLSLSLSLLLSCSHALCFSHALYSLSLSLCVCVCVCYRDSPSFFSSHITMLYDSTSLPFLFISILIHTSCWNREIRNRETSATDRIIRVYTNSFWFLTKSVNANNTYILCPLTPYLTYFSVT